MHPCRSLSRIRSDRRIFKDGTYLGDSPQGNPTHISGPGDLEHKQTRLREGLENFGVFSRRCPTGCKVAEKSNCRCADFIPSRASWRIASMSPLAPGAATTMELGLGIFLPLFLKCQYMPSVPGPAGRDLLSSGISATSASVVSNREAIEPAFCRAVRTTSVGSITPTWTRSSNFPVCAL